MVNSIFKNTENNDRKLITYQQLIKAFMYSGGLTIPELSKQLDLSIPTVAKFINYLVSIGLVMDMGKRDNVQGRLPSVYDLDPAAGYFIGVNYNHDTLDIATCDFSGEIIHEELDIPFKMTNTQACLDNLIVHIKHYIDTLSIDKRKIFKVSLNISGRVNPFEGLSYSIFNFVEEPLAKYLERLIGYPTCIDNDTRAMAYGEFTKGCCRGVNNAIYVNMGWGMAIGIIVNGQLYFGKSGYSGEYGHMHAYDNEIMCHCGKKGCLETEVSGMALLRETIKRLQDGERSILTDRVVEDKQELTLADVLHAIKKEDVLCIEVLQHIADELGKNLAGIINIFNPEMLVIGGDLSQTGDYITQPVSMAIKKYSLNVVNEDSKVVTSTLKARAGVIGACMIARRSVVEQEV